MEFFPFLPFLVGIRVAKSNNAKKNYIQGLTLENKISVSVATLSLKCK